MSIQAISEKTTVEKADIYRKLAVWYDKHGNKLMLNEINALGIDDDLIYTDGSYTVTITRHIQANQEPEPKKITGISHE